jgi:hypothetical protein
MEYLRIFKALQQFNVKYLVCGGLAVNIYGIPRMTADIDLLIDFDEENITNFESAIKLLVYQQRLPVPLRNFTTARSREAAVKESNLIAYSYYSDASGFMDLDVLLDVPVDFEQLWKNRTIKKAMDVEMHLVGIEDLIVLKKYANRIQDQNDVLLLSKLKK